MEIDGKNGQVEMWVTTGPGRWKIAVQTEDWFGWVGSRQEEM